MSEQNPVIRSFGQFLAEAETGDLHRDLSDALVDMIATLNNHRAATGGKPRGKITLAIDFKLDGDLIEVSGEFKVNKPRTERARSIFWTTPENNLSRLNPRQADMFVREVADPAQPIRKTE